MLLCAQRLLLEIYPAPCRREPRSVVTHPALDVGRYKEDTS